MRTDIMPPHEPVQQELERRYVGVEGNPPALIRTQAADPEAEVTGAYRDAQKPADGDGRIVGQHHEVMHEGAGAQLEPYPPELPEHGVERARRPARLLAEELGPGCGPLANRDQVRGVDRPPSPARGGILGGVDPQARRHVFGDRSDVAFPDGSGPDGRVGPDEHRAPATVPGSLDNAMEQ